MDEALFFSAEIYNNHLSNPELAKELYEQIIFNHQDSIYFVEARKEYRILRGDSVWYLNNIYFLDKTLTYQLFKVC